MSSEPKSQASLSIPGVPGYLLGRLVSALGRSMLSLALGWQVYATTHSPFALGLIGLVQVVPVVALVLIAGAAADRLPRRMIGAATQLAQALIALALAGVFYAHLSIWWIYPLLFLSGVANAFASPAISALLPQIVPTASLVHVNAWAQTSYQLASTTAPALAGAALAGLGSATPLFVFDAFAAAIFAVILVRLPVSIAQATPVAKARTPRDLMAGVRFVFRTQELLGAITLDLFAVLLGGATALMPIFAKDILDVGPQGLGLLLAAPSVGSLLMAIAQTRLPPIKHSGRALLIAVAGFGVATLGFGLSKSFVLSLVLLFFTGVFDAMSVVVRRTLEQVVTPDRLRGRVAAVHYVFIGLSNELGEFESGTTAALLGPVGSVLLGGIGTLCVVGFAAWKWPLLRGMKRLDEMQPRHELASEILGD